MGSDQEDGPNKVVVTMVAIAAGLAAQKALGTLWRVIRGSEPTKDDNSPIAEIVIFAALSAATAAAVRQVVSHQAERRLHKDSPSV